jgi:DNA-binding NtrC family response regulator
VAALLLVEDEEAVSKLLTSYLERQGHHVLACNTAESALALFKEQPSAFSLVIADLTLPGMQGDEMIRQMLELRPGMPAVLSSGYPYEPAVFGAHRVSFLQKPFLPSALVKVLNDLI